MDVFGTYNRGATDQTHKVFTKHDSIVALKRPNEPGVYRILGVSGGGGGHAIYIKRLELIFEYDLSDHEKKMNELLKQREKIDRILH